MEVLADFGYKKGDGNYGENKSLYQKQAESNAVCETNERLFVNIWEYTYTSYKSYEIEIVAELTGIWWILKAHSLKEEELSRLPEIENILVRLFNAIKQ